MKYIVQHAFHSVLLWYENWMGINIPCNWKVYLHFSYIEFEFLWEVNTGKGHHCKANCSYTAFKVVLGNDKIPKRRNVWVGHTMGAHWVLHVLQGRSVPVNILCKMSVKGDGIAPSRQTAALGQPLGSGNSPEIGRPQTTSSPMLAEMKLKLACTCINYKVIKRDKGKQFNKTQNDFQKPGKISISLNQLSY